MGAHLKSVPSDFKEVSSIIGLTSLEKLRKVELPEVTLSLRNNPPKLMGEPDPETLPDDLVKVTRTPDKMKIKAAIEAGRTVEGYAMSNQPPSLMIRVK